MSFHIFRLICSESPICSSLLSPATFSLFPSLSRRIEHCSIKSRIKNSNFDLRSCLLRLQPALHLNQAPSNYLRPRLPRSAQLLLLPSRRFGASVLVSCRSFSCCYLSKPRFRCACYWHFVENPCHHCPCRLAVPRPFFHL